MGCLDPSKELSYNMFVEGSHCEVLKRMFIFVETRKMKELALYVVPGMVLGALMWWLFLAFEQRNGIVSLNNGRKFQNFVTWLLLAMFISIDVVWYVGLALFAPDWQVVLMGVLANAVGAVAAYVLGEITRPSVQSVQVVEKKKPIARTSSNGRISEITQEGGKVIVQCNQASVISIEREGDGIRVSVTDPVGGNTQSIGFPF